MAAISLDPRTAQLLAILHRGGTVDYTWAVRGAEKTSFWRTVGQGDPVLLNSSHNMYFGVHPCTTIPPTNSKGEPKPPKAVRSQLPYIAAINCLFAEFDAKDFDESKAGARAHILTLDPQPSVIVDSGGGYHCYWLLDEPFILATDADRARADRAQKGWVKRVKSDDGAKDLARVLRVPGTLNFKPEYGPDFPQVRFLRADFAQPYTLDELEALLPPAPAPKERTSRRTRDAAAPATSIGSDHDFDTIADAARNLGRLAAWRRDAYSEWIAVGMALRELGSIGYELWEKWSKLSSKYHPGDCAEKWPTFKAGDECDGITLASLARWAHDDTPEAAPPAVPEQVQRQLEEYKQEEAVRLKILKNPVLEDREKVAWLAMRNTLAVRTALRPDGSVRLSGEDVGRVMGRSESTGNRATRRLDQHQVLICDPVPVTTPDGREVMQMRVQPGPAFDNPDLLAPIETTKKRGGAREGAGRKPKCAACPPETRVGKRTDVVYFCEGCGEILEREAPKIEYLAPEPEINIDCEDAGTPEARPAPVAVAEPEFNFDFEEAASLQAEDDAGPEIKIESSTHHGYLACNSAFSPDAYPSAPTVPPHIEETVDLTTAIPPGGWTPAAIAALPGVRAGKVPPDDPWILLQLELAARAGSTGAESAESSSWILLQLELAARAGASP